MEFNANQRLAITKVISELTDSSGGLGTVHNRSHRRKRFEDKAMIYYERDIQYCLIITTIGFMWQLCSSRGVERTLIDLCSSVNIISLSIIKVGGIPRDRIEQPIEVSGFEGSASFTLGYLNLDLTIRSMREATLFHVIDDRTSYHLLLGRPWTIKYKAVIST